MCKLLYKNARVLKKEDKKQEATTWTWGNNSSCPLLHEVGKNSMKEKGEFQEIVSLSIYK
ncbi:hypothetical protein GCM10011573_06450 [Enterococcus wangshanyuanii]|uniref:Uncharacterized protein n=1 Tax=Enterococcus wangshanyuanii TaxID=2005703 RepID=A0ABQ1NKH7_9ENTE|nr:hypothetical protein GCM10011573_06450 [Enterococcus wangshanyuanii]